MFIFGYLLYFWTLPKIHLLFLKRHRVFSYLQKVLFSKIPFVAKYLEGALSDRIIVMDENPSLCFIKIKSCTNQGIHKKIRKML